MAPFFLTRPDDGLLIAYSPPPFTKRDGRLYRFLGFITRRRQIFLRWNLMELDTNG